MENIFEKHHQKAKAWIGEISESLAVNERAALTLFKAVTHAIRDRLPIEEAIQLGAQFPVILKGFYFEGYSTKGKPQKMTRLEEFYEKVMELSENIDINPEIITSDVIKIIEKKISPGEIEDIISNMPKHLKDVFRPHEQLA